uniref:Transmembrane protein n=1 Tax=Marseillevirus LCMAC101 TaxID=2506602 RepID=A0A481YTV6_9VIRU|nr:MAG: hypothetical protein LCMAC101_08000 [Marseillevirus LCMAC101]
MGASRYVPIVLVVVLFATRSFVWIVLHTCSQGGIHAPAAKLATSRVPSRCAVSELRKEY